MLLKLFVFASAALVAGFATPGAAGPVQYAGPAACSSCHPEQVTLWRGSHHDLAMQPADGSTILGDFGDTELSNKTGLWVARLMVQKPGQKKYKATCRWDGRRTAEIE